MSDEAKALATIESVLAASSEKPETEKGPQPRGSFLFRVLLDATPTPGGPSIEPGKAPQARGFSVLIDARSHEAGELEQRNAGTIRWATAGELPDPALKGDQ
jgi:hypothetical protein